MKELLDDQYIGKAAAKKAQLTTNLQLKSNIYTIVMMAGGVLYYYFNYPKNSTFQLIIAAVLTALCCLFISLLLELFRLYRRQAKEHKTGEKIIVDPLWFLIWEGGFSIWLILFFFIIVGSLF